MKRELSVLFHQTHKQIHIPPNQHTCNMQIVAIIKTIFEFILEKSSFQITEAYQSLLRSRFTTAFEVRSRTSYYINCFIWM